MKKWFATLSIRAKLILIILAVSFVIVTLVGGVRIAWDMQQARQALVQDLSSVIRLLGNRSSAALAFDDDRLARENLISLNELPHVIQACLYRNDGSLLADYQRGLLPDNPVTTHCPSTSQFADGQTRFEKNRLHLVAAVQQGEQSMGWIYLGSDLSPIEARLHDQLTFSGLALLVAILFSGLLAAWLQRLISSPIAAVTKVAREIEGQGGQHLRAPVSSNDEVGQLALSFNAMLDALETQNQQLVAAKAEQQIASARFRNLVESTSAIPWELDLASWRFIYVGRQAEDVLGYPVADWYQKDFWTDHLHPEDRDQAVHYYTTASNRGENYQFEYRMLTAKGRSIWIHDDVQVVTEEGKTVRLQGFMFDISVRKEMEKELLYHRNELENLVEQRTAELRAANQELESFSYSISHDLRAPLRSISGFSQMILEDYNNALDSEGQNLLSRVIDNAQRMAVLIDDLLELSRLGRKELNTVSVDFDSLVTEVAQSLQDSDNQRTVEFTCDTLGRVTADQGLLKVVIENLLGNAWKYTSKIDKACIEIGKQQTQNGSVFFIKDNGAGFDMAYVNKIFGAFQRLHKRDEFEGTGIGLATVQHIIHRHGGRIWADAKLNKGATFYFTLEHTREI